MRDSGRRRGKLPMRGLTRQARRHPRRRDVRLGQCGEQTVMLRPEATSVAVESMAESGTYGVYDKCSNVYILFATLGCAKPFVNVAAETTVLRGR